MANRLFRSSSGQGRGLNQGQGRGLGGGNKPGSGPTGSCVCPKCGHKMSHQIGKPCFSLTCPKCGAKMARE